MENKIELKKIPIAPGDLVQLNPFTVRNPMFAGCVLVVTEVKSFGCQGFVQALGEDGEPGGRAYYRPTWEEMALVGRAAWIPKPSSTTE